MPFKKGNQVSSSCKTMAPQDTWVDGPWSCVSVYLKKKLYIYCSQRVDRGFGLINLIYEYTCNIWKNISIQKKNPWENLLLTHHFTCLNHFPTHQNQHRKMKYVKFEAESKANVLPTNKPHHFTLEDWWECLKYIQMYKCKWRNEMYCKMSQGFFLVQTF